VVTLISRRDYYDSVNGAKTVLTFDGAVYDVAELNLLGELQQATTEILEAIPEVTVHTWLDREKITRLELEIDALCNSHVACHVDPVEKAHWMGVALSLDRKQALWQADQLGGNPDLEAFPPLTTAEKTTWSNLAIIQGLTANCRDAAAAIAASLYQMTSEEINALPDDWVATHILWP